MEKPGVDVLFYDREKAKLRPVSELQALVTVQDHIVTELTEKAREKGLTEGWEQRLPHMVRDPFLFIEGLWTFRGRIEGLHTALGYETELLTDVITYSGGNPLEQSEGLSQPDPSDPHVNPKTKEELFEAISALQAHLRSSQRIMGAHASPLSPTEWQHIKRHPSLQGKADIAAVLQKNIGRKAALEFALGKPETRIEKIIKGRRIQTIPHPRQPNK